MIVITLPFPPSTNNLFINTSRGRIRSSKYDEWATAAGWELLRQRPDKITGPVTMTFEFQEGRDKRKRDISNLIKAPEDLLVKHGVIQADDNTIVREIKLKWAPDVVGVRVAITPIVADKLKPVAFSVDLNILLAETIRLEAAKSGHKPETLIAEAVRAYMGDA